MALYQVDAEHSGLGNAEVAGDAGGNVDFLCGSILALQIDHAQHGGALCNVGQRDHRPQQRERSQHGGNDLRLIANHVDGEEAKIPFRDVRHRRRPDGKRYPQGAGSAHRDRGGAGERTD